MYKGHDEVQSQSYKVHSNNSPDDELSNGSPTKMKATGKRLKWVLVSEGDTKHIKSGEHQTGTLKLFLNRIKSGASASEQEPSPIDQDCP